MATWPTIDEAKRWVGNYNAANAGELQAAYDAALEFVSEHTDIPLSATSVPANAALAVRRLTQRNYRGKDAPEGMVSFTPGDPVPQREFIVDADVWAMIRLVKPALLA